MVDYVQGERGGLVVEPWTLEREVGGSIPTSAVFKNYLLILPVYLSYAFINCVVAFVV